MGSILNVDVAVNQSQLNSAVSHIQKTISSASYGGGGFGGFSGSGIGGFSFPSSFSGGAMPGRGQFIIPPHPHQAMVQSSVMPASIMRQQISSTMSAAMQDAASGRGMRSSLQYMMPTHSKMTMGKLVLGSAAKAAASAGLYNAGSAIGAALFPPMPLIGAIGGGLVAEHFFGQTTRDFVGDMFYGGTKARAYSTRAMSEVTGNMKKSIVGSYMASTMGFSPADFATPKARAGFIQQMGGVSLGMSKKLRMEPGELASITHGLSFTTSGGPALRTMAQTLNTMKSASTGKFDQSAFLSSDAMKEYSKQALRLKTISSQLNVDPREWAMAEFGTEHIARYRKPKVSTWTRMGRAIGKKLGFGKKWGVDLIGSIKPLVTTDLLMSDDQLKLLGNSRQRAASYAQFTMSEFGQGGSNWMRLALLGQGKMPGGLMDIGGQLGAAFSDPSAAIKAQVTADLTMKKLGGKGVVALSRKTWMDRTKFARDAGIINDTISDDEFMQSSLMNQGMSAIQARALSRATFGVGDKILYSASSKFRALKATGATSGLISVAREMIGVEKGQDLFVTKGLAKRMKNFSSLIGRVHKLGSTDTERMAALRSGKLGLSEDMIEQVKLHYAGDVQAQTEGWARQIKKDYLAEVYDSEFGVSARDFTDEIMSLGLGYKEGLRVFEKAVSTGGANIHRIASGKTRRIMQGIFDDKPTLEMGKQIIKSSARKNQKAEDAGGLAGSGLDDLIDAQKRVLNIMTNISQKDKQRE